MNSRSTHRPSFLSKFRKAFVPKPISKRIEPPKCLERLEDRIAPAAVITATLTDNTNSANPGSTIHYTEVVSNTALPGLGNDALGVQLIHTLDPNLTLVPGSLNISPLAFDDTYSAVGNTQLFVGTSPGLGVPAASVSGNVLTNDVEFMNDLGVMDTFTLTTTGTISTAGGGTVVLNTDGTFIYTPAVGFTGTDTFSYTIADDGVSGLNALSSTGTVSIAVANKVWYVDSTAAAGGNGTSASPFNAITNISGATGPDVAGDIIYIHERTGDYNGNIGLLNNQQLIGSGVDLVVNSFTLLAATSNTTLVATAAGTNAITLGTNNTVRGFGIGNTTGAGLFGSAVGNLVVNHVSDIGTGKLLDLTGGTNVAVTLDTGTTTSSANEAIKLTNMTGNVTVTTGAISGVSGTDVLISGGSATVAIGSSITGNAGGSIDVSGITGGSVTFSGNLSITGGTGISVHNNTGGSITFSGANKTINTGASTAASLDTNTGATVNFTNGGLDLTTTSGSGFSATGGGTVSVSGMNNTIVSTTGTALNIVNTNIDAAGPGVETGLRFRSISSNGAFSGIVLNNTGTAGGLTVTGTGAADGSGGTIQNTTGPAINLTSTSNVHLNNLNITNSQDDGIRGSTVTGLFLDNLEITGSGNAVTERGIDLTNLLGNASISNTTVSGSAEDDLYVQNSTGTLTLLDITGSTFSTTSVSIGNDGIHFEGLGNANMSISVANSTFANNRGDHFQVATDSTSAAVIDVVFKNNTLTGAAGNLGAGITINTAGTSNVTFDILNNAITGAVSSAVTINASGSAILRGNVIGNTIGNAGVVDSGSSQGDGINVTGNNASTTTVLIDGNTIRQYANLAGVNIALRDGSGVMNATVTNNLISNPGTFGTNGILAVAGSTATDAGTMSIDIKNNTLAGSGANGGTDFRVRQRFGTTVRMPGYGGGSTDTAAVVTFIQGNNPGLETGSATVQAPGGGFINTPGGAPVPLPPAPLFASPEIEIPATPVVVEGPSTPVGDGNDAPNGPTVPDSVPVNPPTGTLSQAQLDALVEAAIARWSAAGLTSDQIDLLRSTEFEVADLPGRYLGEASGNHITLDADGAGVGWFVDSTPMDDVEFTNGTASGRLDALTAVMHEFGHVLGLDDSYLPSNSTSLMFGYLTLGERRAPEFGQANGAVPHAHGGPDFVFSPIVIGTLPAGKSVTVNFDTTVVGPNAPAGLNSVSMQGTVQGSNFTNVLTDDPDVVGVANPTVTPINAQPDLQIVSLTDGVLSAVPGGTLNYTLTYGNAGNQDATGVILTESLPAGTTFNAGGSTAGWTETSPGSGIYTLAVGNLAAGVTNATAVFSVNVINPAAAGLETIVNSASIDDNHANGADPTPLNNFASDTDALNADQDLTISKSDGGAIVQPGGTVTYSLGWSNTGNQNASNVFLSETVPANTTFNAGGSTSGWSSEDGVHYTFFLGNVTAGQSGSVNFAVSVFNEVSEGATEISNTATISSGNGPDANPQDNTATDTTPIAGIDLTLTKSDDTTSVLPGSVASYLLNYANVGISAATGVVITETLPAGTTFNADASTEGWSETSPGSGVFELTIGSVGVGGSGSVTFAVTVNSVAAYGQETIFNTASITDDGAFGPDQNSGDNTATDTDDLNAAPDLEVTKTDGVATTTPGSTLAYLIDFQNIGSQNAGAVVLHETLPAGTTFNSAVSSEGWTAVENNPGEYIYVVGNVEAGGSGTVSFVVTVDNPAAAGLDEISNTVTINDDGAGGEDFNPANNTAKDVDTLIAAPDLSLTKTDNVTSTTPGSDLTYVLTYANNGNQGATGVYLIETAPAGTSFNPMTSSQGWIPTENPGQYILLVGNVAAGSSDSYSFGVTVNNPAVAGQIEIVNKAAIADNGDNGVDATPDNNSTTDIDTLEAAPELTITKSDDVESTTPGSVLNYFISYSNSGNQDATGVVLHETLPVGTAFNSFASSEGWVETSPGSGQYTLTIGNLGAGISASANFAVTVTNPAASGLNQIVNTASISDDGTNGPDTNIENNTVTDTDTLNAAPDLVLTKTDNRESTTPGSTLTYVLSYSNAGDQNATGVTLHETLPAGTTFNAGASTAGWQEVEQGSGEYILVLGNLGAGTAGSANFVVTVNSPANSGLESIVNNAFITDNNNNGEDPTPGNNSTIDTDILTASPDLVLTKTDNVTSTTPGSTLTYVLSYANNGTQNANKVFLTETLPVGTTFNAAASTAGWTETSPGSGVYTLPVGTLAVGSNGTANFVVTVNNPAAAGLNSIVDTASISDDGSNGEDPTPNNNTATDTDTLNAAPDLVLTKTDNVTSTTPGSTLSYVLNYANNGNQGATSVVLHETLPVGTIFNSQASSEGWVESPQGSGQYVYTAGSIGAGGSGTATFAVTVINAAAAGLEQIVNTATINDDGANGTDTTPGNNTTIDTDTLIAAPELTITKSDEVSSTTPGSSLNYVLFYSNVGNQNATGVVLHETLPAGTTFNAVGSSEGWVETVPGSGQYTLAIGNLGGDASGSRTFSVIVTNPAAAGLNSIVNTASINDDGTNGQDTNSENNIVTDTDVLNATPDLVLTKTDNRESTTPGSTLTYVLSYSNAGNQNATGVTLHETLPVGTTFNAAASTAGWQEVEAGSGQYILVLGNVGAGTSGNANFVVTVNNPANSGLESIVNNASISDDNNNGEDPNPGDNSTVDSDILTAAPDLVLIKTDNVTSTTPGSTLTYVLSYANNGTQNANKVFLTETLPAGTTFNAGASTAGWFETSPGSGVYTLSIGSLAVGANGTANFVVAVNNPAAAGLNSIVDTASISDDGSNGEDPTPNNNTATDTDTLNAAPDLVLTKTDSVTSTTPGSTLSYVLNYANNGNQGATGVVLHETLPAGAIFNSQGSSEGWIESPQGSGQYIYNLGSLEAGGSGSRTFAVTVINPAAAGLDQIVNNATINDDGTNGADTTPGDNATTDTDTLNAAPDLRVTKTDEISSTTPGSTLNYVLFYSNVGNQNATGVVLHETLPAGTSFNAAGSSEGWVETAPGSGQYTFIIGNLGGESSGSATFSVSITNPAPAGVDNIVNTVTINDDGANGADQNPENNSATDSNILNAAPDLLVTKTDNVEFTTPGSTLVYGISYSNVGNQGASGVVLHETLPIGTTFNAAGSPGWVETEAGSGQYILVLGTVPGGTAGIVNFAVNVISPAASGLTQISNSVSITDDNANGADPTPGNNFTTDVDILNAAPDLVLTKTDNVTTTTPGSTLSYVLNYANNGDQAATKVVLTETVPIGTTFNAGASSQGWVETEAGSGVYTFVIGTLGGGLSGTATFAVTLVSPAAAGLNQIVNTATLIDDGSNGEDATPGNNTVTDADTLDAAPDLVLTKTDNVTTTTPGSTLSYVLTYANNGNQNATGVELLETLPVGTTFNAAASSEGWVETAPGSGQYTYIIGNLAAGDSGSRTFVVTVTNPAAAGLNQIVDTAAIHNDGNNGPDPTPENNIATDTDTLEAAPDLVLTKTDNVESTTPGSALSYVLSYSNGGNQNATGVILHEFLPAGTAFNASASSEGWVETAPGSGEYTLVVGNLAAGASSSATFAVTVVNPAAAGLHQISDTATINDDGTNGADQNPENNTASDIDVLNAAPELSIIKTDSVESTTPGSGLTYVLTYQNNGNQDATGVVLHETLPAGATFNAAGSSAGWVEAEAGSGQYTLVLGNLGAGTSGTVNFAVSITSPAAAGLESIVNTASINDDGSNGPDTNSENNTVTDTDVLNAAPDLVVTKTALPSKAVRGGTLAYTIDYSNVGNQNAVKVFLTETLPANTTFVANGSSIGWTESSPGSGVYTFSLGELDGGESGTVTFVVKVNSVVPGGTLAINNTVTLADNGANGADPNPNDNSSSLSIPLYQGIYAFSFRNDDRKSGGGTPPEIKVYDAATGELALDFLAYASTDTKGVRLTVGDLNGDGYDDIITSYVRGTGRIRAFDGVTGEQMTIGGQTELAPFSEKSNSGAFVAAGDVTGDGHVDIIVGAGFKGKTVKVYDGVTGSVVSEFKPFGRSSGGVRVAVGDMNGDGIADIIAGRRSGGGNVKAFAGGDLAAGVTPELLFSTKLAKSNGVYVAAADIDGAEDGRSELIMGSGDRAKGRVAVYSPVTNSILFEAQPYTDKKLRGVRVAAVDVDLDGIAEIIAAPGSKGPGEVVFMEGDGTPLPEYSLTPFPEFLTKGIFDAGSATFASVLPPEQPPKNQK